MAFSDVVNTAAGGLNTAAGAVGGAMNTVSSGYQSASNAIAPVTDALDNLLAQVPAMLLVFPSAKIPIPVATIPIMFNPEKLRFDKSVHWHEVRTAKRNAPTARFGGGGPEKLNLKLFLDSSKAGFVGVQGYVFILKQLLKKPPVLLDQPPLVQFVWGLTSSQMSYIESMDYEYTLFTPGGKPLQAEVTLSLVEYDMGWLGLLPINPTSRSEARKTWVVVEGQTLDWIAYQEYGDSSAWRHIAQVNNLKNPMQLRSGQILKLTPLG